MIHFTADTHFGDEKILKICQRPFPTIEEHDDYLISEINKHVSPEDTLIVLGDFCKGDPRPYLKRINANWVTLVVGNHDSIRFVKYFDDHGKVIAIRVRDLDVFLSHYPHAYWPNSHHGSAHLYGHVHDAHEEHFDNIWPERRSLDVGVDTARRILGDPRPWTEDEIYFHMILRKGHDSLEFYHQHEEHRSMYQVDSENQVIHAPPSLDTRPALVKEVAECR